MTATDRPRPNDTMQLEPNATGNLVADAFIIHGPGRRVEQQTLLLAWSI